MAALGWNFNLESQLPSARDSIPRLICDSVLRCETDVQTNLFGNMVVTGGGSSFEFLPDRIKLEVEKIVHVNAPSCRIKTMAAGATERAVCTWLGGSILASIGAFHDMWISRQEYNEFGASLVDRKCP
jgi:actin-related protein